MIKARSKRKSAQPRSVSRSPKTDRSHRPRDVKVGRSRPAMAAHADEASSPTTKRDRVLAMLRAPKGASLAALAEATQWQSHSVRGFLAGVVRKKLGLTLVSALTEDGRIYRIADKTDAA